METSSWHPYPKVYAVGHAAIAEIFQDEVIVEEKVDGSQFSFGVIDGTLKLKTRRVELILEAPTEKMFKEAVETVIELKDQLHPGWTYRAEYFKKPKHNTLAYSRIPAKHLIVFDINTGEEHYLDYEEKKAEAARLGLETVPLLYRGKIDSIEQVMKLLEVESVLGGQRPEGIVFKNYKRFSRDGKAMIGKYVSEAFKEVNQKDFRDRNPTKKDIIEFLGEKYRCESRWQKAIFRLRDEGKLENDPKDISSLLKEISTDLKEECTDEIKDALFKWAWPMISRSAIRGFPEWYKEQLLQSVFANDEEKESA